MKRHIALLLLIPSLIFGAENISTAGSIGENYSTLAGWFTAKEGDISAGNAEVLECYDTGAAIAAAASGTWTTDSDSYVSIRAATGEETDGTAAGAGASLTGTYITNVTAGTNDYFLEELNLLSTDADELVDISTSTGTNINISRCVFNAQGNVTLQDACLEINASADIVVTNCLFLASADSSATDEGHGIHTIDGTQTLVIYNCTFIGWDDGVENDGGTITAQNVITYNCTDGFDEGGGAITKTTCISDISGDANTQTTQNAVTLFTLPGSGDFSVKDASSDLYDAGTDLSGTFTTDIINNTRVQWDAGAFEFQVAAEEATGTRRRFIISN